MVLKAGGIALVCAALPAGFARADPLAATTFPASTPSQAVWSPASSDPDAPFYAIDWSLGLRGSYIADSNGERFQSLVLPTVTLTHTGNDLGLTGTASAQISKTGNGQFSIDDMRLAAGSVLTFNPTSSLATNASLAVTQENPHNPGVATNVSQTPVEVSGTVDGTFTRKLGHFDIALRGNAERDVYGSTVFTDGSTLDNTPQNNTQGGAGLRVGFELTPVLQPFVDVKAGRTVFDAPSTGLGVKLDGNTYAVKTGVSAKWDGRLEAEASIGLGLEHFDDVSLSDVEAMLYNASLTYHPTDTLTLNGDFTTSISAPGPNAAGSAKIDYAATAKATYLVNDWLTWRLSADWHNASFADTADSTDKGYDLGAGADYLFNRHAKLSADYTFSHSEISPNPATDSHTVTVGLTVQK
jgi:hypothetical protein